MRVSIMFVTVDLTGNTGTIALRPDTPPCKTKMQVLVVLTRSPVLWDPSGWFGSGEPKCAPHLDLLLGVSLLEGRRGKMEGIVFKFQCNSTITITKL